MKTQRGTKEAFIRYRTQLTGAVAAHADIGAIIKEYNALFLAAVRDAASKTHSGGAVCASGSFSRGELTPFSTAEILFFPDEPPLDESARAAVLSEWAHISQSLGVKITVHFVCPEPGCHISVENAFRALASSPKTILRGGSAAYARCMQRLHEELGGGKKNEYVEEIIRNRDARIREFGNSASLLEPHLLNSAGGLLDVRLCELLCGVISGREIPLDFDTPYEDILFAYLCNDGFLSPKGADELRGAYRRLLQLRFRLHLHKKYRTDRLEYSSQRFLVKQQAGGQRRDYIASMKKFYAATAIIVRTLNAIVKKYRTFQTAALPEQLAEALDETFYLKAGRISAVEGAPLSMGTAMRAFFYRAKYHAWFSDGLRNDIQSFVPDPEAAQDMFEAFVSFKQILQMEQGVGEALSAMHQLAFLGKFLPVFEETTGFPQNPAYHSYTVDEHTLKSISAVEALDPFTTLAGKVFKSLPKKELLYLALLFHDAAKPIATEGHEHLGAEYAVSFMEANGYDEKEIAIVDFVVRRHEIMYRAILPAKKTHSDTAQHFAARFPSAEHLDYLYVGTTGDLSAADPRVLNSWKAGLLASLYLETRRLLTQKQHRDSERETIEQLAGTLPPLAEPEHQKTIFPEADEEEAALKAQLDPATLFSVAFKVKDDVTEAVFYLQKKHLLAKIAGVLSINGTMLHGASLSTRDDGFMAFSVKVRDMKSGNALPQEVCANIENDLTLAATGLKQIGSDIKQFREQWQSLRRTLFTKKHHHKLHFASDGDSTTLRFSAPASPGILYRLLQKFYDLGLLVHFMKSELKDDHFDFFFSLSDLHKHKISTHYYHFIETELRAIFERA